MIITDGWIQLASWHHIDAVCITLMLQQTKGQGQGLRNEFTITSEFVLNSCVCLYSSYYYWMDVGQLSSPLAAAN